MRADTRARGYSMLRSWLFRAGPLASGADEGAVYLHQTVRPQRGKGEAAPLHTASPIQDPRNVPGPDPPRGGKWLPAAGLSLYRDSRRLGQIPPRGVNGSQPHLLHWPRQPALTRGPPGPPRHHPRCGDLIQDPEGFKKHPGQPAWEGPRETSTASTGRKTER